MLSIDYTLHLSTSDSKENLVIKISVVMLTRLQILNLISSRFFKMQVPISKNIVISLVIGFIFGLSVSLFTISKTQYLPNNNKNILRGLHPHGHAHSHEDLEDEEGPPDIVMFHNGNESVHRDEDLVARQLAEKVKVLCWVMTQPKNHKSKVYK